MAHGSTWWKGESHIIPDKDIHIGEKEWKYQCKTQEDKSSCVSSRPSNYKTIRDEAKNDHKQKNNSAESFITEMFFRCWWHNQDEVAQKFKDKGWKINGKPVDKQDVADLCLTFQDDGYGYVEGWKNKE